MWLAFRAHGAAQFRDAIERNLAEADLLYRHAQTTEDFEVMEAPPQLSIVPIRHVPPRSPTSTRTTRRSPTPSRPMAAPTCRPP